MKEYIVDAAKRPLGRVASEIAVLLQGKNEAEYDPKNNGNIRVVVQNINKIIVTGKKAEQKIYYKPTGYIGNLKEKTYKEAFAKDPRFVLIHAVRGMLPKNRLQAPRLTQLVFAETKKEA